MNPDTRPTSAAAAPRKYQLGRGLRWGVIAVAAVAVLAFFIWRTSTGPESSPQFVWLTTGAFAPIKRVGVLTRMKYRLINLTVPIWGRFRRARPQIRIDSALLSLTPGAASQTGLAAPVAISPVGLQAWILSASEAAAFRGRLQTNKLVDWLNRPRIDTGDGGQASMTTGGSTASTGYSLTIDLTPKIVSGGIRMSARITSTEITAPASGNPGETQTNLSAACRTLIPNGGALVLCAAGNTNLDATNYWFILSPIATDSRGNPIKL